MKKIAFMTLLVTFGCGYDFGHVDYLDVVEPIDDAPAPFTCQSQVFGHVESEQQIDCGVFEANAERAVQTAIDMAIHVDPDSFRRIMGRSTVHVRADYWWNSRQGVDYQVNGETWFNRVDTDRATYSLGHEIMHLYDIAHWRVDTSQHPGWKDSCKLSPQDTDCNFWDIGLTYANATYQSP